MWHCWQCAWKCFKMSESRLSQPLNLCFITYKLWVYGCCDTDNVGKSHYLNNVPFKNRKHTGEFTLDQVFVGQCCNRVLPQNCPDSYIIDWWRKVGSTTITWTSISTKQIGLWWTSAWMKIYTNIKVTRWAHKIIVTDSVSDEIWSQSPFSSWIW